MYHQSQTSVINRQIKYPRQNVPHRVNPADVWANLCEDGGFLRDVAALTRTKAHHTVDLPGTINRLAIQRSPRVSLQSPQSINSHSRQSFLSGWLSVISHYTPQRCRRHQHRPSCLSPGRPTSRPASRCHGRPLAGEPAAERLPAVLQLWMKARVRTSMNL